MRSTENMRTHKSQHQHTKLCQTHHKNVKSTGMAGGLRVNAIPAWGSAPRLYIRSYKFPAQGASPLICMRRCAPDPEATFHRQGRACLRDQWRASESCEWTEWAQRQRRQVVPIDRRERWPTLFRLERPCHALTAVIRNVVGADWTSLDVSGQKTRHVEF